jgi:MFS family permease
MSLAGASLARVIESDVPARMDRMPRSRWHWMIVFALGITWVLDGLEVQLVGNSGPLLQEPSTLNLPSGQVGTAASVYLLGEVAGALFFGYMTDRLRRKRLFMVTLVVYLVGTFLTAFT